VSETAVVVPRRRRRPKFDPLLFEYLLACAFAVALLFAGQAFESFMTFSDGAIYLAAYDQLKGEAIDEAYIIFTLGTGSSEPISFLVYYLFAQVVDLSTANWILNVALFMTLSRFLQSRGVDRRAWGPFVITNFYILLLGFGVLRLKIAVILLVWSWMAKTQQQRWSLRIASVLAHLQMSLPLAVSMIYDLSEKRSRLGHIRYVIGLVAVLGVVFAGAIQEKLNFYLQQDFGFPFKMLGIFVASLFLLDRRRMALVIFGVFFPMALAVGDTRLNIIYVMLILGEYLTNSRRTQLRTAVLLLAGAYLSLKGLDFARSLIEGYNFFED